MVAIINSSSSVSRTLNYNEQKCKEGSAVLLHASRFIKETKDLNFYDKLRRFEHQNALNQRTKLNTLHVSLNFDPSEKLTSEKLIAIATDYMEKIGFAAQPWLLYRHDDTGHPHIHIISINIQENGKAISMHNLGRNKSEHARQEIEEKYHLVKASTKQKKDRQLIKEIAARKVEYGKMPLKKNINAVLNEVIKQYKYSSLAELNAVLGLYNVRAERGEKGSRIYQYRGLMYRVIDAKGNAVGPPIKASRFATRPTLAFLEKQFEKNKLLKRPFKDVLKNKLDQSFVANPVSLRKWMQHLQKQNIDVISRVNEQGVLYGITYIDHESKCVFKGSDIAKEYSANLITQRFKKDTTESIVPDGKSFHKNASTNLLDLLLSPEWQPDYVPYPLKKKRKKRRRKI